MENISFLLGAGFSIPEGYKGVKELNKTFVDLKSNDFSIDTDGTLGLGNQHVSSYNKYKPIFIRCLKYYTFFRQFDYERFFDFLKTNEVVPNIIFKMYLYWLRKKNSLDYGHEEVVSKMINFLNQLVFEFLTHPKSIKLKNQYINKPNYPNYNGFLNTIQNLQSNGAAINFHTLNHDLLFEKLMNSAWLQNNYSDGFTKCNTPFYGIDHAGKKVHLAYFDGNYSKQIKLFKLHGSFDYYPYRLKNSKKIDRYIKVDFNISNSNLFKNVTNPSIEESNDFGNYHSDFLSGTTSKIGRYNETFYSELLGHFKNNLKNSERLIIIGYGCSDSEINKLIKENFKFKPITIINPKPGIKVKQFARNLNARLLEKNIDDMTMDDI